MLTEDEIYDVLVKTTTAYLKAPAFGTRGNLTRLQAIDLARAMKEKRRANYESASVALEPITFRFDDAALQRAITAVPEPAEPPPMPPGMSSDVGDTSAHGVGPRTPRRARWWRR